jgi:hypothetical protein
MMTKIRTFGLAAAASFALAFATTACGDSVQAPSPQPELQQPPAPAPIATFSVSGTISEATESGSAPLEGARVMNWTTEEVAVTDADGNYTLHGISSGFAQFSVSKDGYEAQDLEMMIEGDARLDATLVRSAE